MALAEVIWQLVASALVPVAVGIYVGQRAGDDELRAWLRRVCRPIVWGGWVPVLLFFQATLPGIGPAGFALYLHQAFPQLSLPTVGLALRVPLLALWLTAFTALITQRYAQSLAIQVGEWPGDRRALFWPAVVASISAMSGGLLLLLVLWVGWVSLGYRLL
jgi:hypothetical protein